MCGRFVAKVKSGEALPMKWRELHALLAGYNIAPTQSLFAVLAGEGEPAPARATWGLVTPWSSRPLINARAETVASKPSFREAFRARRCLVPADGWYEWQKHAGGKRPFFIHAADGEPFGFAGVWGPDERGVPMVAIITTEASEDLRAIHDRMPAVLRRADWGPWLDASTPVERLGAMLRPMPEHWAAAYPVSPRVGSPRFNDAACIAPAEGQASPPPERGLFG